MDLNITKVTLNKVTWIEKADMLGGEHGHEDDEMSLKTRS